MHPLSNVIWQALTTRQAAFAEAAGQARRFPLEVTLLAAFETPNHAGYESLAGLVGSGGTGAVFLNDPYEPRSSWEYVAGAPLLQMICENGVASRAPLSKALDIVELGDKGYAARLMTEVMRRIRERGETPILHVRSDNARAIAIYQRLGFRKRWEGHFAVLRRISAQ
jgi:FR47-like protein